MRVNTSRLLCPYLQLSFAAPAASHDAPPHAHGPRLGNLVFGDADALMSVSKQSTPGGAEMGALALPSAPLPQVTSAARTASQDAPPHADGARARDLGFRDADALMDEASQSAPGGATQGAPELATELLPLPPVLTQAPAASPVLRTRHKTGISDQAGSTSLSPPSASLPACLPQKTPEQRLAADLAERFRLRVIQIPGDGHCLFGAFSMSRYGTATEQSEFRLLLADVLRRPDFATLNPVAMVDIYAEGFTSTAGYAKRVVRADHWGTFADASILCGELGWGLAVYNTIAAPPHDRIEYVHEPQYEGSKVIELLHTPTHWDLLERVEDAANAPAPALPASPSGQQGAPGATGTVPERGSIGSLKPPHAAPAKPGPCCEPPNALCMMRPTLSSCPCPRQAACNVTKPRRCRTSVAGMSARRWQLAWLLGKRAEAAATRRRSFRRGRRQSSRACAPRFTQCTGRRSYMQRVPSMQWELRVLSLERFVLCSK